MTPRDDPTGATPDWWEDPDLAQAVAEVERFAGSAGWDRPAQLFALVDTDRVRAAQPELSDQLAGSSRYTPIAQDDFDDGGDLEGALSRISWPPAVAGCALVQEILVLPPSAADELDAHDATDTAGARAAAAEHPARTEARLVVGVLRSASGGACLLRVRGAGGATPPGDAGAAEPLRGGDLAPGVVSALRATFA